MRLMEQELNELKDQVAERSHSILQAHLQKRKKRVYKRVYEIRRGSKHAFEYTTTITRFSISSSRS